MKQTAVNFLIEQIASLDMSNISDEQWFGIIGEARAMERQQIIDAHSTPLSKNLKWMDDWRVLAISEHYYTQTFTEHEPTND
jgi:hypothetical protein